MPRSTAQNEQMRAESRANILATARQLFAEYGYEGCSVSDIARQAGMSQGNIYWYFPSKEALLAAVLADAFEGLGALFQAVAAMPGTGREKLDDLIRRYIDFGNTQGGAETTLIIASLTARGGIQRLAELGLDTGEIGAGAEQALAALIAAAQAEGALRPEIDPLLSAAFFFSFFNGLVFSYREDTADFTAEAIHAAIWRLLGGIDP